MFNACALAHPDTPYTVTRELEEAYEAAKADPKFQEEVDWYRREYIGGPTPMYHAKRLTEEMGGAQVRRWWLGHTARSLSTCHAWEVSGFWHK